ncbi:MAG: hypothetical protein IJ127_04865 [Afipia sp.]|nr:hypothetical protein [Afipia sp.]
MKYGDFSSLVQLGAGVHAGTALLQLYGEFGLQPVERAMARIKDVLQEDATDKSNTLRARLDQLEGELAIFRIKLFNEYKKYVKINFVVAILLMGCLAFISFVFDDEISFGVALFFLSLSCLPAPITLLVLWFDANAEIKPLRDRIAKLEEAVVSN